MALPLMKDDLNIIQKLDDEPNDVGGLSAEELKAKFDEAGNAIKKYLNETLIPQLDAEGMSGDAQSVWEPYDSTKTYVPGNKVYYAGSSYLNKLSCTGIAPTQTTYWQIIAQGGSGGGEGGSGADGFSPVVEMSKADGVTTITITDKDSVQTTTIEDGEDGVSPTIDVSKSGKVTTLTIHDAEGTKTVNINDGADGADGEAAEEVLVEDVDMSNWYSGSFEMTYEDGTVKEGSVTFDSNNRPKTITLNGHTLTLTLPEVE